MAESAANPGPARAVRVRRPARPESMRVMIWSRTTPTAPTAPTEPAAFDLGPWIKAVIIALGALGAIPLAGLIGFRHGFAEVVGVPDLQREAGAGLTDGVRLILLIPRRIFEAGMLETAVLFAALLILLAGAGALTLIVLAIPAEESETESQPHPAAGAAWALGAVVALLISLIQIAWLLARGRPIFGDLMPWDPETFGAWLDQARLLAGVDLIAFAAAVVWLIFATRLRTMAWLKVLTVVAAASTVVALYAGSAMSSSVVAHADQIRSVIRAADGEEAHLLLGHTATHLVVVTATGELELVAPLIDIQVVGRAGLTEFLRR